jgi:GNAT superfamily N-acetyltransferase
MSSEPSAIAPSASPAPAAALRLLIEAESGRDTKVHLVDGERTVSWLWIVPFTLRIGAATVRMDGIGGVGTEEDCRKRGYARRVLEAAVEQMRRDDAALSMLYGIPHFYPKFGYATAGPDQFIELTRLSDPAALPPGWRVRSATPADLPAVRRLYEQNTATGVGCAVRSATASPWRRLEQPKPEDGDDCRVVEDHERQVRAYAWRARWHWYVGSLERGQPEAMVIAEVMADGPAAADAVLAACRQWSAEESASVSQPLERVVLPLPPEGPVAAAAMRQSARSVHRYVPCGSSMARVLDVGRLLQVLQPELALRLEAAGSRFTGTLRLETEIGAAALTITPDGVTVAPTDLSRDDRGGPGERLELYLPQAELARLALGVFPPGDILARLEQPPDEETRRLVEILFPLRHPHMYLPDRF